MERRFRLTSNEDFRRVRRTGKSYAHPLLILITAPDQPDACRIGVAASKRVGGAVQRNRARRRLRHAIRPHLSRILPGRDVLLIARPALVDADWPAVQAAVAELLKRAGCLPRANH
jgi:ribonuclease P protein component